MGLVPCYHVTPVATVSGVDWQAWWSNTALPMGSCSNNVGRWGVLAGASAACVGVGFPLLPDFRVCRYGCGALQVLRPMALAQDCF